MKSTIRTMTAIILTTMTFGTSFSKTSKLTKDQYTLLINKTDVNIIGTWEKFNGTEKKGNKTYCQFNSNGTYVSYESRQGGYFVTGRGKWTIEDGVIYILHGAERSAPVKYEATANRLMFGADVFYIKQMMAYVSK